MSLSTTTLHARSIATHRSRRLPAPPPTVGLLEPPPRAPRHLPRLLPDITVIEHVHSPATWDDIASGGDPHPVRTRYVLNAAASGAPRYLMGPFGIPLLPVLRLVAHQFAVGARWCPMVGPSMAVGDHTARRSGDSPSGGVFAVCQTACVSIQRCVMQWFW